jgi:tRNA dimethylallyltransferase
MPPPAARPGAFRPGAVLLAGPTASGKSALALALAERLAGTVVNADAMQVYRELSIVTARPTPAEMERVPHRLYGHVAASDPYSVARWLADAGPVLADLAAAGRRAIIVGGTGLYFEALTRGLSLVPEIPDAVRERVRARSACLGPAGLHEMLARRDPEMAARLRPTDPQRILRALEVVEATGRSLAEWQAEAAGPPLLGAEAIAARIVLAPDRGWLHARIAGRFEAMLAAGAGAEAARFAALGLDPALPAARAIGIAPLAALARGEGSVDAARHRVVVDTRRYAKRQETWFRNRMAEWARIDPAAAPAAIAAEAISAAVAPAD